MGWIILTGILGLIGIAGLIWWVLIKGSAEQSGAGWGLVVFFGSGVLWVAISLFMTFHTVGQREVAIVYNFSNTISGKRDPGVVTVAPWQHIKKENVGILHDEWQFSIGDQTAAVSKDQQQIGALLSVNYQIDADKVVDLYSKVGPSWKKIIIDARVPQVFKEVTATYATTDITASREQLRIDTKKRLINELAPYDINVVDVFVKNLGFSQVYRDAIDRKQKQVQDALTAEAKVRQVQAEAQQKIAAAKGEATANIERARGDATANRLRQRSLTKNLIQWEAIQKLNPNVDIIVCPPQSVCIPNSAVVPQPGN